MKKRVKKSKNNKNKQNIKIKGKPKKAVRKTLKTLIHKYTI